MVGKLHKFWPGGHIYLLVAVDWFTKWIEAKPITTTDATAAVNFIKGILLMFGVPNSIVTDNGSNFTSREFKDYCEGMGMEKERHGWVNKLPNTATQETPFFLVHGTEAMLPIEIKHNSPRVVNYDEETSQKALEDDIDAVDEARDVVLSRVSACQQNLKNYHSRRLRPMSFEVGDLVLRLKQDGHEKLESPWLGPYIVTEVIQGGAYRLKDKKTRKYEENPWNIAQQWSFYA
jgi:transposase InsO family protein